MCCVSVLRCKSLPCVTFELILSRKAILIPAGIKVNTCVMTHVLCLISEISFDKVSLLVVCILPLSSEDATMWISKASVAVQQHADFVQHL